MSKRSEADVLQRALELSGRTLGWVAAQLGEPLPLTLLHAKGWIGRQIERWLEVPLTQGSGPDFPDLPLEVKTIPVDRLGRPTQSTFIAYAALDIEPFSAWEHSGVWQKLQRVLWVPVQRTMPLAQSRLHSPLLWSPTPKEAAELQRDWCELMERITLGMPLTADYGEHLQLRPKAAHRGITTTGCAGVRHHPRAFYLRSRFTQKIWEEQ